MKIKHAHVLAALALCSASPGWAQDAVRSALIQQLVTAGAQVRDTKSGTIVTPPSSLIRAEDAGVRAHTNVKFLVPAVLPDTASIAPPNAPPFRGYYYETPSSLACGYNLVTPASGCNPNMFHANATGGGKAIAIVDAFNDPSVRSDLAAYSAQFGLPPPTTSNFQVWYCGRTVATCNQTTPPVNDRGWSLEIALDVEMAHALAPSATIYLVEAASSLNVDLYAAVDKASQLVAAAGGGEVSMSWGGNETRNEALHDSNFQTNGVVYFASSGDSPGTSYPAVSSYVVCVGGTSFSRDSSGALIGQATWDESGGGPSQYIARPSYQPPSIGSQRGCPDMSADANPETGVWVYCTSSSCGRGAVSGNWYVVGGTSVASPSAAAIVNNAGSFMASTTDELSRVYDELERPLIHDALWFDVTQGYCGPYAGYWAARGYDFCTGVGAPKTKTGK